MNIFNWINRKREQLAQPTETGVEHDYTGPGGWGHAATFNDDAGTRMTYFGKIPKEGDVILKMMQSGKVGRFLVVVVAPCRDPHDMAFLDVKFVGYKEGPIKAGPDWRSGALL